VAYDLGDVATPALAVTDSVGNPANAGAVTAVITLPDATTTSPSITNPATGLYRASHVTTLAGRHIIRWTATGANAGVHVDEFTVRDLERPSIVSLPDARRYLRLGVDTSRDDELRSVMDAATSLAEAYTGRTYRRTVLTEIHDGGRAALVLRHTPVQSIVAVTVDGSPTTNWVLHQVSGILLHGSTMAVSCWPSGIQHIIVTYVAGPLVVPPHIAEAVLVITGHLWDTRRGGSNLPRQAGADAEYSTATPYALPRRAEQILDRDRAPGFG
jgi:uncharacterized phiE125 gp8 family phage protein